jgi:hypothetical protein
MQSSKTKRLVSDQKLIRGIKKNLGKSAALVLMGQKHTIGELLSMLEARVAAAEPVETAKGAWQALVAKERLIVGETQPVVDALRRYLVIVNGDVPSTLAKYGIAVRKRRELTAEEKADRARKASATRKAHRLVDTKPVADAAPAAPPVMGGA